MKTNKMSLFICVLLVMIACGEGKKKAEVTGADGTVYTSYQDACRNLDFNAAYKIIELTEGTEEDKDYVYAQGEANSNDTSYYYSYLPEQKFDVPVGAFSIELDNEVNYGFSRVDCAFVDKDADAVEAAVKKVLEEGYRTVDIMPKGQEDKFTSCSCSQMGSLIAQKV